MILSSVCKICRTCWTSSGKIKNMWQIAPVIFNQMPAEEVKMCGKAQKTLCTLDLSLTFFVKFRKASGQVLLTDLDMANLICRRKFYIP